MKCSTSGRLISVRQNGHQFVLALGPAATPRALRKTSNVWQTTAAVSQSRRGIAVAIVNGFVFET